MGTEVVEHGEHAPTVNSWSDAEQQIHIFNRPGFLWTLLLRARINASPDDVYRILTDEHPERVFRGIKAVTHRKVLQEDKRTGKRTLELTHRAITKFLWISVTFDTHLFVDEDPVHRTIHFRTAREGFMKQFNGQWTVQPFTQHTLDTVFKHQHDNSFVHSMGGLFHGLFQKDASASLVTLEQSIEPKSRPPKGIQHLVHRMLAAQVQNLMADVREEVKRQEQGKATASAMHNRSNRSRMHMDHGPDASSSTIKAVTGFSTTKPNSQGPVFNKTHSHSLADTKEATTGKHGSSLPHAASITLAAAPRLEGFCFPLSITVHL